jgi:outer membrane murein-binding lipoprotein Lpp
MSSSLTVAASATASAASTAYGGGTPSATSLQAQLERFQKQLSDCVNCASAKTPQGKSDIQAISARISQIEQRIAQAQNRPDNQAAPQSTSQATAPAAASSPTTGYGSLIDVFA